MQLRSESIREGLTAATCALVGLGAAAVAHAGEIESAGLLYSEKGRVTALEGTVRARREIGESGRAYGFRLIVDALTGASANGAAPASIVQTFTSPSGGTSYNTPAGKTPLDDTFKDTRYAGGATWEEPLGRLSKGIFSVDLSTESDYNSVGAGATFSRDFFLRNTTLVGGIAGSWDRVGPMGGAPDPLTPMPPPGSGGGGDDDKRIFEDDEGSSGPAKNKTTMDLMAGVTQILSRSTLMEVNYSRSHSSGYLTDPYKLLSVIGAGGEPAEYRFEKRPDSRTKQTVYAEAKHHFDRDLVDLSYRYLWDDWGVVSHTIDIRYRWQRDGPDYWEPHVRFYRQGAADFYRRILVEGEPLPEHASADYRLGDMDAYTVGLKYGRTLVTGHRIGLRLEYYEQKSKAPAGDRASAIVPGFDLYPAVRAGILQFSYSIDW